jgi:hypothetical protein
MTLLNIMNATDLANQNPSRAASSSVMANVVAQRELCRIIRRLGNGIIRNEFGYGSFVIAGQDGMYRAKVQYLRAAGDGRLPPTFRRENLKKLTEQKRKKTAKGLRRYIND